MRKPLVIAGALLVGSSLLWKLQLGQRWTDRLSPGWSFAAQYVGTQTWPDSTGKLPPQEVLGEYERGIRVLPGESGSGSVILEDRMAIREARNDSLTWEYVTRYPVDPRTGAHLTPAYAGEVALFPRHVEQGTYRLRSNYLEGIPLTFEREERIQGLKTYIFSYEGPIEYTESYLGTAQYPGIEVGPEEEIRCADDQFRYAIWIEPATGATVKLEEACPSGDYIFKTGTDSIVGAVLRWSGETSGEDLLRSVDQVRGLRSRYFLASLYVPAVLAIAGLALLVGGFWQGPSRSRVA